MIIRFVPLLFLFLFHFHVSGQENAKMDYHPPLAIPLILSANFGELRPNHFHMGIDFKTMGKIGYKLYSVEDGYVSRIKVSPYGYGKVIYIDHPNGVTSVYAHCSEFKGKIDSIVRLTQIKEQNYEVEIFPGKGKLKVKRGEIIALSGNTGGSTAPHLHFELRDTKTEHALNPLVYGFDLSDSKKPEIRGVKIYGLTKEGYVFNTKETSRVVSLGTNGYYVSGNKITIPSDYLSLSGGIGFAFDVIDRLDGAANQCGLYGSFLIVNNDTLFGQRTDRIPFESTRFVNCHKDYKEYQMNHKKYHKSFRTRENDLPIYSFKDLGILQAKPGETFSVKYIAFDSKGNASELAFELVISQGEINQNDTAVPDLSYLQPSQSMRVENKNTNVEFGITTVYEPLKIEDEHICTSIGKADIPVHKPYRINIKSTEKQDGKHYIEMITAKGSRKELPVQYNGDVISCESKFFGRYTLKRDTIAPTVIPSNFTSTATLVTASTMKWKISDSQIGIADYDLFIDGEWKLLEYEYKNSTVTYQRDPGMTGTKEVLVRVTDACGNVREWKKSMTFK